MKTPSLIRRPAEVHLRAPLQRGARHAAVQKSGWVPTNAVSELDNERFPPMQNSLPEFPGVVSRSLQAALAFLFYGHLQLRVGG